MEKRSHKFTKVLPVLFYEYLALSIPKAILPGMLVKTFGVYTYFMVGIIETIKGLLAFFACPLFGKLSDIIGRKYCLLITVVGTTFPVCVLAFTSNMYIYGFAVSISGAFSATFPLTFAYISDCVENTKRAPAFGLALATFGLSFTIGPIVGGYMELTFGVRSVFAVSLFLVVMDVFYVMLYLPETADIEVCLLMLPHTTVVPVNWMSLLCDL
jgi:MFS transporter, DHA1 family, tetracycline resistance protein